MKKNAMRTLLYSGGLLGVDLGTWSVKAIHVRRGRRGATVLTCDEREVWKELAAASGPDEVRRVYSAALAEMTGSRLSRVKTAAIGLPAGAALLKFVDVTNKRRIDAATGLPEDAVATVPFDLGEAAISARTRPGRDGGEEMVLLTARRGAVDDAIRALRAGGLAASAVLHGALAAGDAVAALEPAAGGLFALADIGAATTTLSIHEEGECRAARVINIAGTAFTRALRRELGELSGDVETVKRRNGLEGSGEAGDAARRALTPVVRDLCNEVRRTLDSFADKRPHDAPHIGRLLICGGSAALPGLAREMSLDLGMKVEVFRPLREAKPAKAAASFDSASPAFAVAAGLSLHDAVRGRSKDASVNLLPRGAWRAAVATQASSKAVAAAVAAALVLGGVGALAYGMKRRHQLAEEALFEQTLAKARADWSARRPKKPVAAPKPAASPFAYLRNLQATGVFNAGAFVMLSGGDRVFAVRGDRLFDEDDKPVPGVSARVARGTVSLTTVRGEQFSIPLPK